VLLLELEDVCLELFGILEDGIDTETPIRKMRLQVMSDLKRRGESSI